MSDDIHVRQSGGILGPLDAVQHYQIARTQGDETIVFVNVEGVPVTKPMYVPDLLRHLDRHYDIGEPEGGWRDLSTFTDDEIKKLRPIAETLAMLSGNAFFGNTFTDSTGREREWFEMYVPEADALYQANGGDTGWAGESSFLKTGDV
jgi:hypothetical protein